MTTSHTPSASDPTYIATPNLSIDIGDTTLAYRDLGPRDGVPVVLLNHWGAVLDNFDPRIVDGLASRHRVIATDYRGIGGSGGAAPLTVDELARDAIALIRALGFERMDLFGFSLGGFVAQDITLKAPGLVRKLILTGTGPAGGKDIDKVGAVSQPLIEKGMTTGKDPKFFLFFTSTDNGRQAAEDFLNRLQERKADRDKDPTRHSRGSCKPSRRGAGRRRRTSAASVSLSLSPTATRTSWCRRRTATTWRVASRTRNWSSTRTPDTAASFRTMRTSYRRRWPFSRIDRIEGGRC